MVDIPDLSLFSCVARDEQNRSALYLFMVQLPIEVSSTLWLSFLAVNVGMSNPAAGATSTPKATAHTAPPPASLEQGALHSRAAPLRWCLAAAGSRVLLMVQVPESFS